MNSPSSRATALVVASLNNRLQAITEVLENVGWTIRPFQQVGEALEALRNDTFEAVFCDEYLRGASSTGFLAWSRRLVPDVPFHLFCVDDGPKVFTGRNRPDSLLIFPPITADVPLPNVMHSHKPVRESARDLNQGIRALAELLVLPSTDFEVRPFTLPRRKTIHLPTTSAVTEAARLNDERSRDEVLVRSVQEACPSCDSIVIGYSLSQAPSFATGERSEVFTIAKGLLEQNRDLLGKITHLSVENDGHGYALLVFGEGNLLAGRVPQGKSLVLLAAMAKAVRAR
jgi:hypothetical protein